MAKNNYAQKLFKGLEAQKLKEYITPMLAKSKENAFDDPDWIFEIKWDGYRAIADLRDGLSLYSRNGLNFEGKFPQVAEALSHFENKFVLDGEIVSIDKDGKPSFQQLQHSDPATDQHLQYQVFDILYLGKKDLTKLTLLERKKILQKELPESNVVRFSDHVIGEGIALFEEMKSQSLEGMMAKRSSSIYSLGKRTGDWLKIRNHQIEEAIIVGYTEPQGGRKFFGSLILARYREGKMYWAGQVGTGFTDKLLKEFYNLMQEIKTTKNPFPAGEYTNKGATWIRQEMVANIKYSEITTDGKFRHPVFLGLREDKTANDLKNLK